MPKVHASWMAALALTCLALADCKSDSDNGDGASAPAAGAGSGVSTAGTNGGSPNGGAGTSAGNTGGRAGSTGSQQAGSGGVGSSMASTAGMGSSKAGSGGIGSGAAGTGGVGGAMAGGEFTLTSTAFKDGEMLPMKHRCYALGGPGNSGPSPQLSWTGAPAGAMSFAVTLTQVAMDYAHWTIYDIPSSVTSLPEGVPEGAVPAMPAGAKQAPNESPTLVGGPGYFGPCLPSGVSDYDMEVFALDVASLPGLTGSSTLDAVRMAIDAATIASAKLSYKSGPPNATRP